MVALKNAYTTLVQYIASNLETTDHTVVITHDTDNPLIWFDLDYVVSSVWESSAHNSTTSDIPAAPTSGSGSSTPVAAIAGGAAGGVLGLAAIGLLIFFLLRRRRRRSEEEFPQKSDRDPSPMRHAVPYQPGPGMPPPGGYGTAGLGAGFGTGAAALGPGMQQRYGSGPESEFAGSTVGMGSEGAGSTLGSGSQTGHQRQVKSSVDRCYSC